MHLELSIKDNLVNQLPVIATSREQLLSHKSKVVFTVHYDLQIVSKKLYCGPGLGIICRDVIQALLIGPDGSAHIRNYEPRFGVGFGSFFCFSRPEFRPVNEF